jgi:hypothetical protein
MNRIKEISLTLFLACTVMLAWADSPQIKIPNGILSSMETGDAKALSAYFNQNIELVVLDNDNVYSKAQAQQVVSIFFSKFTPIKEKPFSIIHQTGKADAQSVIGKLKTEKGDFRVYFLLKKNGDKEYIHQLRIEQQ